MAWEKSTAVSTHPMLRSWRYIMYPSHGPAVHCLRGQLSLFWLSRLSNHCHAIACTSASTPTSLEQTDLGTKKYPFSLPSSVRVAQWWKHRMTVPLRSQVRYSQSHSSCDRDGNSLWQHGFSPGALVSSYIILHYKSPNIVYGANNVKIDAQLSIQMNILIHVCTCISNLSGTYLFIG
jgi:hypothetical protein